MCFSLYSIRTTQSFWFSYSPDVSIGWLDSVRSIRRFFGILLLLISLLGTSEPAVKNNWSRSVFFKSQRSHWSNLSVIRIKYHTFVFEEYSFNYPWPQIVQKNASNELRKLHKWSFYYVVHILLCVAKACKEGKNCCMFFSLKYLKMCLYSLKLKFIILWISCEHLKSRWGPGNSGHTCTYLLNFAKCCRYHQLGEVENATPFLKCWTKSSKQWKNH